MGFMSRDCRKVIDHLLSLSGEKGPTVEDVINAEQLVFTYYGKTIVGHISRFFNPESKGNPNRIEFYIKPTKSINKGKRTTNEWIMSDLDKEIYLTIGKYLIEDYSVDQLKIIKDMCKYQIKDIEVGIQEAQKEQIYSVFYLQRIVEGIAAKREHTKAQRQHIKDLYKYDGDTDTINRTPLELASMKYNWQNEMENTELQRKLGVLYETE